MMQRVVRVPVSIPATRSLPDDNHGAWFLADSKLSAKHLTHRFNSRMMNVGSILYECVGGIVQAPRKKIYIQVQLVKDAIVWVDMVSKEPERRKIPSYRYGEEPWPDWTVELCLQEIGVHLRERVPVETVLTAYHMRGRA